MTKTQRLRMTIDITMTILSIILMGGNYLFPADIVHEILGVGLFVLWGIHIALNRRWYSALFRGKYNPYRVMQTIINCCILICTILLMISGIILSNHLFTFLNIQGGLGFARIAHLLASHLYYLFMSLHIGLHVGMISNKLCHSRAPTRESSDKEIIGSSPIMTLVGKILLALACAYGIYAFIARGVWKYLILRQQFFFFDLERGYILFAIDYISIIIMFSTLSHLLAKKMRERFLNN
ncbi:MAG: DUF4405 domain-containing protein [Treponema sp.]|nr:DUF4405 domain-containing protein [Treponema sp.]